MTDASHGSALPHRYPPQRRLPKFSVGVMIGRDSRINISHCLAALG
jgi:hypothetical protein